MCTRRLSADSLGTTLDHDERLEKVPIFLLDTLQPRDRGATSAGHVEDERRQGIFLFMCRGSFGSGRHGLEQGGVELIILGEFRTIELE